MINPCGKGYKRSKWLSSSFIFEINHIFLYRIALSTWTRRKRKSFTFCFMLVLTRYGCFGEYVGRVATRERTRCCHDCGAATNTTDLCCRSVQSGNRRAIKWWLLWGKERTSSCLTWFALCPGQEWQVLVSDYLNETVISQGKAALQIYNQASPDVVVRRWMWCVRKELFVANVSFAPLCLEVEGTWG